MDYLVDGGPIQPSSSGCMRNVGNTRIIYHPQLLQISGHQQYHSTQRGRRFWDSLHIQYSFWWDVWSLLDTVYPVYTQYILHFHEFSCWILGTLRGKKPAVPHLQLVARVGDVTAWVPSHCIACGHSQLPELPTNHPKIPWVLNETSLICCYLL